jgi:hypothetical protein
MNHEEIRIAIAEACGWTYHKRESWPRHRPKRFEYILQAPTEKGKVLPEFTVASASYEDDVIVGLLRLPDYPNDLNCMREAWACVIASDTSLVDRFENELTEIVIRDAPDPARDKFYALKTNASAAQRAEAYLRTLGKWQD